MKTVLSQMLAKYDIHNLEDKRNAIKEVIQEVILCGLSRGDFFKNVAFYGGTALRIFYGLDRFSEDLDFSLISEDDKFRLDKYFTYVENELKSLGLCVVITEVDKTKQSSVKSAFLKANTKEVMIAVYDEDIKNINHNDLIKIKFEIDTTPIPFASYETKVRLLPSPYQVKLFDKESLFAGKIHACLCRNWQQQIKGRDFYDYIFFLSMNIKVNLDYLKAKLIHSNFIDEKYDLSIDNLKILLNQKFESLNFNEAKKDVLPFIKDKAKIDLWDKDFFIEITKTLQARYIK